MAESAAAPAPASESDASDHLLVRAVLDGGSERACRLLYRRHATRLYRLAWRMLGSRMDAEDVVQETWLRALPRLQDFAWRSSLGTWLCGILVNVARETLARRGRWTMDEMNDAVDAPTVSSATDLLEQIDIEHAIGALAPGCRAVFLLHDVEGFTHDEIAERLGCTAGTSKTQLFRARRALRRLLGEPPDERPVEDQRPTPGNHFV